MCLFSADNAIQLKDKILVTGVSVEHIPKSLALNGTIESAPRDFSVFVSIYYYHCDIVFLSITSK